MHPRGPLTRLSLLAGALVLTGCAPAPPTGDVVIDHVNIVDIASGEILPDRSVLVGGGRILAVTSGQVEGSAGIRRIDAAGAYAIPGLWDMHVHALWDEAVARSFLPEFVRHGVTGVRDMGGTLAVLGQVREAQVSERPPWPRIVAAGEILDGPEPVQPDVSIPLSTIADARRAVDSLARFGVDFIKVYTLLPREVYFAVLEAAREHELPVVGHVPGAVTVMEAIAAGQVTVEHLRDELGSFCTGDDAVTCDSLLAGFVDRGVFNTPTLVVLEAKSIPGYARVDRDAPAPEFPAIVRSYWDASRASHLQRPDEYFADRRLVFEREQATVGLLARAGAPLLAGSDAGNPFISPGASLHRELELMVASGLTARDALATATILPARFLGMADSLGAVREGFVADVVLLDGNPLEDIANVRHVRGVLLRGTAYVGADGSIEWQGGTPERRN